LAYALRRKALLFMYNMIKEVSTNEVFQLLGKPELKSLISDPLMLIMAGVCRMNPAADISKAQKACRRNGLNISTGLKLCGQRKYYPNIK